MIKQKILNYYKYKMNTISMNIYAVVLMIILAAIIIPTFNGELNDFGIFEVVLVVLWFILHELFHYVGFLTGRDVKPKDLALGMYIEKGIFYCMCKKLISKKTILIALVFPLFFLGILTLILGYIFNSYVLVLLSALNIAGAIGDILMFIQIVRLPRNIKYTDVDDATGYYLITDKDISNVKTLGIKLDEVKEYSSDKLKHKDNRKIVITKTSFIVLLIIILIFVLSLFNII